MFTIYLFQLAPSLPLQEDFVYHWKAITHYYIETSGKKSLKEQANICDGHGVHRGRSIVVQTALKVVEAGAAVKSTVYSGVKYNCIMVTHNYVFIVD